jgi:hypothetical protein
MNQTLNLDEYNKNSDEFCDICFEKHDKTSVILKCKHRFHYDCILASFVRKKIKNKSIRSCPYCRQSSGYLPLLDGMKPIKHIHKEKKKKNITVRCLAVIKNGKRKGKSCKHSVITKSLYCGIHKNYINK